jgi:hypothetical protein
MRDKLVFLLSACDIFTEMPPDQLRVLLWLRLSELPVHLRDFQVGLNEGQLRKILSDFKQKAWVGQRVLSGPYSMTAKGNQQLDLLLTKISAK